MHSRLHKKLTLIYSFTTGIIITLVILFVFLFIRYQMELSAKKVLTDTLNDIQYKLQTEQQIGQSWLSTTSSDNEIYIYIEDNQVPLKILNFVSTPNFQTSKSVLVNKAKELADKIGIDTSLYLASVSKETSPIFFVRGDKKEPYYSCVSIFSTSKGWQTVIMIQSLSRQKMILTHCGLLLFIINCMIVLFLYLFSRYFVGKTLEPVIVNEKKQKEFIASASHELKSPLSVIRATVSSLMVNEDKNDKAANYDSFESEIRQRINYYNDIDEEAQRMAKLINDLLLLTSSQAQKRILNKETFDTEAFLIDLYEAYSLVALKKELNLLLDLPEYSMAPIHVDKLRLRQVITILLDNAISYTRPHESIMIQAYQRKQLLVIKIIDHGIGIPDEKKPFIFDNFYRADPSRIDRNHFGLGLSIAKELIALHCGSITVSDTAGGGTTFTVEIPVE